jgi:peptide deformylase
MTDANPETDVKLSWLTRLAVMLGLGTSSHAMTTAERREKMEKDLEEYMRGKLPEVVRDGDVLPLVFYPNKLLRQPSIEVTSFDGDFRQLMRSLGATMYLCGGVGLSAVQVGIPLRAFVADVRDIRKDPNAPGDFRVYVNPVIVASSPGVLTDTEGCLSMPSVRETIQRPAWVNVSTQDAAGNRREDELVGWPARVVLHEMEHLDGKVFIDSLGGIQKRLVEKRIEKLRRSISIDEENARKRAARSAAKGRGRAPTRSTPR